MSTLTITGGCACSNCGGSAGHCGCDGQQAICTDVSFERPRFFAGQLLTEDDLQALTDYVVGKNRLHNRFLFGDGVVCGLNVTCHPCGDGKVVIAPGFALDCCGNDILLPCAEELDAKALLRDLRQRQLAGYECGDPCDEKDGNQRNYGLYVTYTEIQEDPVAPYSSADPCGQQGCEPTRICEGYKFELRCDCEPAPRAELFKRILDCIGDLKSASAAFAKAQSAEAHAAQYQQTLHLMQQGTKAPLQDSNIELIRDATEHLAEFKEFSLEDTDEEGNLRVLPTEKALRLQIGRLQLLTGSMARWYALPEKDRAAVVDVHGDVDVLVKKARKLVADTAPILTEVSKQVISDPASQTDALETVRLAQRYMTEEHEEGLFDSFEGQMMIFNTPYSLRKLVRMQTDARLLKEWLLDKLDNSAHLTHCNLRDRVLAVNIEADPGEHENKEIMRINTSSGAVRELVQIMKEYLADCICLALNPPCQACEDPGVLLACVTIEDCEVIDICNMSRRFVLSPTAMRYWLPPITSLGEKITRQCCEPDAPKEVHHGEGVQRLPDQLEIKAEYMPIYNSYVEHKLADVSDVEMDQFWTNAGLQKNDVQHLEVFLGNLARLWQPSSTVTSVVSGWGNTVLGKTIAKNFGISTGAVVPDNVDVEAKVHRIINKEVEAARKSVGEELTEGLVNLVDHSVVEHTAGMAEDIEKGVTERVSEAVGKDLSKELSKSLTADVNAKVKAAVDKHWTEAKMNRAVGATDTIKELKAKNRELTTNLNRVTKALEKLKAGG